MFGLSFKKKPKPFPKNLLPKIRTKTLPGPASIKLTESLKRFECPAITYVGDAFPIFLKKGFASNLIDVDNNRYLDFTSSFGVANLGYDAKAPLAAMKEQAVSLIHGMGDVHPTETKVFLAKRLSEITPGNLCQTIFSSTGTEAVESALKTAMMATKKPGVIAFTNAYHGLGYGALSVTDRDEFKAPFIKQLGSFVHRAPYPDTRLLGPKASELSLKEVGKIVKKNRRSKFPVGSVILEPVQGRGGHAVCPADFLRNLRALCDEEKILLIVDEVYTGFGRTGSMFAIDRSGVVPDLLCMGKAMANGLPISACIGSMKTMHLWGASTGEAIHTSTFLGHPLASAVSLAVIDEMISLKLPERAKTLGDYFRKELWKLKEKYAIIADIRGQGLMIGIELSTTEYAGTRRQKIVPAADKAKYVLNEALRKGLILLTAGPGHNVLSLVPPLIISEKEISFCVKLLDDLIKKIN